MNHQPEEIIMTEPEPYATLERVTLATDGGMGGRGTTRIVYLTPEKRAELWAWALDNRTL